MSSRFFIIKWRYNMMLKSKNDSNEIEVIKDNCNMKINYSTNGVISIGELLGLINDDVAKDTIVGAGQALVVLGETLKNSQQKIEDLKDRAH
jgi:hypothetical protein